MSAIQNIVMPKWGLAMQEGLVAAWHVPVDAVLEAGQDLLDIETSKIANVYESPVSGHLRRIVVAAGETVPVGALLGVCAPASVSDTEIDAHVKAFQDSFDWDGAKADTGPEPETAETTAGRLRFLRMGDGDGPSMLFLHGFGGDLNTWLFNQEVVAQSGRTIALDLPGHGGSTKDVGPGDLVTLAGAVMALMDHLSLPSAHLVGHSMGGATALLVALERPDRVASLTLLAPGGFGPAINMDYINGFIAEKRAKKLRAVLELLVADPTAITAEMVEEVIKVKRLDGVDAALKTLRDGLFPGGTQAIDLRDRLAALLCPVRVIWGRRDRILPASQADGVPASIRVTLLDAAGHMPHMESAATVNALLQEVMT